MHLRRQQGVLEQERHAEILEERRGLEDADQFQFVQPAVAADVVQEGLLEDHACAAGRATAVPCSSGQLPQGVHHPGAIDRLGAARRAGLARHALPDGLAAHRPVREARLHQPHDLVGNDVHALGHGTSGRALAALVTVLKIRLGERIAGAGIHLRAFGDTTAVISLFSQLGARRAGWAA